jgi:4-carboxymuconolactone decarboxylase
MSSARHIRLVDPGELSGDARAAWDHVVRTRGMVGNMPKALANSPRAIERVMAIGDYIRDDSRLELEMREAVIATVAAARRCQYVWSHHIAFLERNGADADLLKTLGTAAAEEPGHPYADVIRLARLVAQAEDTPSDLVERVRAELGDERLIGLLVTIGHYCTLSGVVNTLGVPLEDEAQPLDLPARW